MSNPNTQNIQKFNTQLEPNTPAVAWTRDGAERGRFQGGVVADPVEGLRIEESALGRRSYSLPVRQNRHTQVDLQPSSIFVDPGFGNIATPVDGQWGKVNTAFAGSPDDFSVVGGDIDFMRPTTPNNVDRIGGLWVAGDAVGSLAGHLAEIPEREVHGRLVSSRIGSIIVHPLLGLLTLRQNLEAANPDVEVKLPDSVHERIDEWRDTFEKGADEGVMYTSHPQHDLDQLSKVVGHGRENQG